ncbi:MAG: matrixin family metalloprotease [Planctomycetota bacterium]
MHAHKPHRLPWGRILIVVCVAGLSLFLVQRRAVAGPPGAGTRTGHTLDPSVTDPAAIWHLDADTLGTWFTRAIRNHGMTVRGTSPAARLTDRLVREHLLGRIVERVNEVFLRQGTGAAIPGLSFPLTFTVTAPDPTAFPGGPGIDYSRICFASRGNTCSGGTLGAQFYDPGNRHVEWQCEPDQLGVFAARVCGVRSVLGRKPAGPRVRVRDLHFLDGRYRLGSGSDEDDQRFLEIDGAIFDWGTALGNVCAHEIGHALGLAHDPRPGHLMQPYFSSTDLSDAELTLSRRSVRVLDATLGRIR